MGKLSFTKEQLEDLYIVQNKSLQNIAEMYGVNHTAILYWIKKFHILTRKGSKAVAGRVPAHYTQRRYNIDENFFSTDSPAMYWSLGFIAADGCIERDRTWSVCQRDIEPLEKIKSFIGDDLPIKKHNTYRLRVNCTKHIRDMEVFGITRRKSSTLIMPKIPEPYFWHFLRGYFDGDGSVYRTRRKIGNKIYYPIYVKFIGSPPFIRALSSELNYRLNTTHKNSYKAGKNKLVEYITYRDRQQVFAILWNMYKESNSSIRLDRKHMRYQEWFAKECSSRATADSSDITV